MLLSGSDHWFRRVPTPAARTLVKLILSGTIFPLSRRERVRVRGFNETLGPLTPALFLRERVSIMSGPGMKGGKR